MVAQLLLGHQDEMRARISRQQVFIMMDKGLSSRNPSENYMRLQ